MKPVVIDHPGHFVLPDCQIPVFRVKVRRNPQNQIQELIIEFDPSRGVREKLESHKSVPLQFRDTAEQILIEISPVDPCGWTGGNRILQFQHFHKTEFLQTEIQTIERFLESVSRWKKTSVIVIFRIRLFSISPCHPCIIPTLFNICQVHNPHGASVPAPNTFGVHRMELAGSPKGELAGASESNVVQFDGCNLPHGNSRR